MEALNASSKEQYAERRYLNEHEYKNIDGGYITVERIQATDSKRHSDLVKDIAKKM